MASNPTVSIIMATFNRAHFITETINAIRIQSFTNWECLIIDDGSTDNTEEILSSYLKEDERIKYYKRTSKYQKGLPGCRNFGLDKALGELVIFFDDDDIPHPDNLKICIDEIKKTDVDFCRYQRNVFTGDFQEVFNRNLNYATFKIGPQDLESVISGNLQFNSCQVMWKKSCFANNNFNEKLMYAEEWECYSRILADGAKGISVEKVLFYGRKHPESNTGEYWRNDRIRRNSKVEAVKLVIQNLHKRNLLSFSIVKYFIGLGIFLKEKSILSYVLEKFNAGKKLKLKYSLLYDFYPYIVWIHRLKKKLNQ